MLFFYIILWRSYAQKLPSSIYRLLDLKFSILWKKTSARALKWLIAVIKSRTEKYEQFPTWQRLIDTMAILPKNVGYKGGYMMAYFGALPGCQASAGIWPEFLSSMNFSAALLKFHWFCSRHMREKFSVIPDSDMNFLTLFSFVDALNTIWWKK